MILSGIYLTSLKMIMIGFKKLWRIFTTLRRRHLRLTILGTKSSGWMSILVLLQFRGSIWRKVFRCRFICMWLKPWIEWLAKTTEPVWLSLKMRKSKSCLSITKLQTINVFRLLIENSSFTSITCTESSKGHSRSNMDMMSSQKWTRKNLRLSAKRPSLDSRWDSKQYRSKSN